MRRALTIDVETYGADHPDVATDLNNLVQVLKNTNREAEAEPLERHALAIVRWERGHERRETAGGPVKAETFAGAAELLAAVESTAVDAGAREDRKFVSGRSAIGENRDHRGITATKTEAGFVDASADRATDSRPKSG
jgi:hypothetical protein